MEKRIFLSSPTMHGEEQAFVKEAFDTNWVAPLGKNVNEFEKEMAAYVGVAHAAALTAGIAGTLTPLNGFNMTEAENLLLYGAEHGLRISGLLVCGVLISALGAVMDVAMTIASAQ